MPWFTRGRRRVTSRWPAHPDSYRDTFPGAVTPIDRPGEAVPAEIPAVCPTGAISRDGDRLRVDQGRCILCHRCVRQYPERFRFTTPAPAVHRDLLVVPALPETDDALAAVRAELARRTRLLRRSIHVRHVDAGSDGADEWEVLALLNPVYDIHRLGIFFTASPRHADVLLVTGVGSRGMAAPLARTLQAAPRPLVVIAAGTDAISGGLVHPTYATSGGIGDLIAATPDSAGATGAADGDPVRVDIWVPGSPPTPFALLHALLLAMGRLQ